MRTLLVDNYDSFTYNLFHYLAEVNGREPEVVTHDDRTWKPQHLAAFDNVVISPGPGTPEREADFGICTEILRHGRIPTLGVCLGHQGIALLYGGEVGRAPEPYHGRVSPVVHEGTGLFEGLPSPFPAVRYHSLAARRLPADLEVTARTPDGIIMGLRHRERPLWGVQFHPESVGSEHGHRILDNFRRLTERHEGQGKAPRPKQLRRPKPEEAPQRIRRLRIITATLPTNWNDEVAFDRLFRRGPHAYWLDSSSRDERTGRFSIMGDASGPLARTATADVHSSTVTVRSRHTTEVVTGRFLDWLDRDLRATRTEAPPLPFDFALGWVGYLGYGLKAECGGERGHRSDDPDATMVFADRALVLDHATGTTHLLALAEDGDESGARTWLDTTARRLAALTGMRPFPARRPDTLGALELRHDRDAYLRLIDTCQEQIAAGESYEICLTNMAETTGTLDPWDGYRFLRRTSPAPFGALLSFGELSVLSTSPERFLRIDATGRAESSPIKGTRPRGATPQEDARLAADLATDEKDRAENLMIVDLVRNDLGRCARIGSVEAKDVFRVESYAKAHQLVSTVRAKLREDHSAVDCVRAAFPPGSMTGAPKIRTMQIIDALEEGPRGVYSGAIGYFSLTGAADLSVVIRTAVVTENHVRYGVGGAIIALSNPEEEYEETAVKAAPLTTLTGKPFPDRRPSRHAVRI
ncbi:aminodeoxychorismate synthase component I [Streptomyces klenkii]|uniref:Aminodeoxychorismate synthase n=1 Tax=Streptomyces klenkii TaxID=1420899 RepID=A0A3B0BHM5_9ACTN|nr:aminodeoxychorismate synthase component I [Streptomyces klenkii]RKN72783.1 aminodeoxychorismate synthase component I [Streptomyces klenkii]